MAESAAIFAEAMSAERLLAEHLKRHGSFDYRMSTTLDMSQSHYRLSQKLRYYLAR